VVFMHVRWKRWWFTGCFDAGLKHCHEICALPMHARTSTESSPPGKTVKVDSATDPCAEGRNDAIRVSLYTPAHYRNELVGYSR